jgi:hypothetical protein
MEATLLRTADTENRLPSNGVTRCSNKENAGLDVGVPQPRAQLFPLQDPKLRVISLDVTVNQLDEHILPQGQTDVGTVSDSQLSMCAEHTY